MIFFRTDHRYSAKRRTAPSTPISTSALPRKQICRRRPPLRCSPVLPHRPAGLPSTSSPPPPSAFSVAVWATKEEQSNLSLSMRPKSFLAMQRIGYRLVRPELFDYCFQEFVSSPPRILCKITNFPCPPVTYHSFFLLGFAR